MNTRIHAEHTSLTMKISSSICLDGSQDFEQPISDYWGKPHTSGTACLDRALTKYPKLMLCRCNSKTNNGAEHLEVEVTDCYNVNGC